MSFSVKSCWCLFARRRRSCSSVLAPKRYPKRYQNEAPRTVAVAVRGGWPVLFMQRSLSLVAAFLPPFFSGVLLLRFLHLLVLPLPLAHSALRPVLAPFLVYFFLSALAIPLGLLCFFFTETYLFRHMPNRMVLPASRKFAEGRGGRQVLEQGILDNTYLIYIYIHMVTPAP